MTALIAEYMEDLIQSWVRSAREAGDPETVRVAEEAAAGDRAAMEEVLTWERESGDPERAARAEAAQEAVVAGIEGLE